MGQERAKVEAEAVHVAQGYSPGLLAYVFWCIFHFLSN